LISKAIRPFSRSFYYLLSNCDQPAICLFDMLISSRRCMSEYEKGNHDLPSSSIVPKPDHLLF
jgi:hypothetical protein